MNIINSKQDHDSNHYPSAGVAWSSVGILTVTYIFSFLDRNILVLLVDPIKADLNITDTQVSLLTGFAFAAVYAVMGIPMGRVADNWVRKYVIIGGVTIWSLLTIYCGFARNFIQLFVARMGVGFGEAALTPTAYSMMPDFFPPKKLAFGMSVFTLGAVAGGPLSYLLGGFIIGALSGLGPLTLPLIGAVKVWQLVLIIVGAASLLMVIPLAFMPEPTRQVELKNRIKEGLQRDSKRPPATPFRDVVSYMWQRRQFYLPFIISMSVANMFIYGYAAWIPSHFIRSLGWDAASAGMTLGMVGIAPAIIGCLTAGWLADKRYAAGDYSASIKIMFVVLVVATPVLPLAIYAPNTAITLAILALFALCYSMFFALFPTVVQLATPAPIRAQVSAVHLLINNMIGIGFGPTAVALITDYGFGDDKAVGHSIAILGALCFAISAIIMQRTRPAFLRQLKARAEPA